eukprot:XP_025007822.1 maestro heat-like repeat-containing protein family member 1 [Gallus gallus]
MWEEAKGKETLASPLLQQFLRASLATMEDEAWTKGLSCELSRWLSSSPSSSGEKSFLYKALGTVLGACKEVLHIQGKLLQHLEEANAEEPSEAQGMISLLSHAAETNFHTVPGHAHHVCVQAVQRPEGRISRRKKVKRYAFPSWLSAALFSLGSPGASWGTGGC